MSSCPKDEVLAFIERLKTQASLPCSLPVLQGGRETACLEPVTWQDVDQPELIGLLAEWRQTAADAFPSQFPVTLPGTQRWLVKGVLEVPDRLLFWVKSSAAGRIGHAGLFRFDPSEASLELDNVVRGVKGALPGVMFASIQTLLAWTFENLHTSAVFLRVFSDNSRAIRLYERSGFVETMRMPLRREQEGDVVRWMEVTGEYRKPVKRYFVTMELPHAQWLTCTTRSRAA